MTRRVVGLIVVLIIAWGGLAGATAAGLTPRLGLDLQGGTSVVLTAPQGTDPDLLLPRRSSGSQSPTRHVDRNDGTDARLPECEPAAPGR